MDENDSKMNENAFTRKHEEEVFLRRRGKYQEAIDSLNEIGIYVVRSYFSSGFINPQLNKQSFTDAIQSLSCKMKYFSKTVDLNHKDSFCNFIS